MHRHERHDIVANSTFIEKFAQMYIDQRSESSVDYSSLDSSLLFNSTGFDSSALKSIILKSSVHKDIKREAGEQPAIIQDIYRSDLGELLMTYYYEEKVSKERRFVIPLKNLPNRELAGLPGRGLDVVGYRLNANKVDILLGEAKVSAQKKNPPNVVDISDDSLYKTHKKHKLDQETLIRKLGDYCRKLDTTHAEIIGFAILCLTKSIANVEITYGCTLIRDYECSKEPEDYGKMKTCAPEFEPDSIDFSLLTFLEKNIEEVTNSFYLKVQELVSAA
mgnify:CR=1 FL=1